MPRCFWLALATTLLLAYSVFAQTKEEAVGYPDTPKAPRFETGSRERVEPACNDGDCGTPACGPAGRFWAYGDLLLWWIEGDRLPPLVTASPPGTPRSQAGVLGAPGTQVLFGDERVNGDPRLGFRVGAGYWLNCEQTCGIEVNYFMLEAKNGGNTFASLGSPILARPFTDATTGQPASELVAFPGVVTGSISVSPASSALNGPEVLLRHNLRCGCCYRVDLLGGWRNLRFAENLGISEDLTSIGPLSETGIPPGTRIQVNDQFGTTNEFNGIELGIAGEYRRNRLVLGFLAKLAVGENERSVDINGSTVITIPGQQPFVNSGGLLALRSNIGHYERDPWIVIPEFGLNVGYQVTNHLRARLGYTFLYWADVYRPGDQIDLLVNPTLIPGRPSSGPPRPAPLLGESDIWVQGLNLGLEFRF